MKTKRKATEEKGDLSVKCLQRTMVVCAVGLVVVALFGFSSGRKGMPASAAASKADSKPVAASFDRQSLSTKNR